jgi:hypothetical protein
MIRKEMSLFEGGGLQGIIGTFKQSTHIYLPFCHSVEDEQAFS